MALMLWRGLADTWGLADTQQSQMPGNKCPSCLLQLLKSAGILNLPEWFDAGRVSQQSTFAPFSKWPLCAALLEDDIQQVKLWAVLMLLSSLAGALLAVEIILFGFVEAKRYVDFQKPGSQVRESSLAGAGGP